MKRRIVTLLFHCSILALFCQAFLGVTPVSAANTNDFYFSNAEFDYYLTKTEDGHQMHVKEVLTAEFPETNQNHGIMRTIPYTNQGGDNITVWSAAALNLTVTRNGVPEPVSISKENGSYILKIGDASKYVRGTQTYVLEYDFENVITEFDSAGANISRRTGEVAYQELYWDTNGVGWSQRFDKLTARVHYDDPAAFLDTAWCYVGYAGEKGQERCTITRTADGYQFATTGLASRENLTFVTQFQPETFKFITRENYVLVIALLVADGVFVGMAWFTVRNWRKKGKKNQQHYKKLFTVPQYAPPQNLTVAEAGVLVPSARSFYLATLLELAVSGKIQIVRGEPTKILKRNTWKVKVQDLTSTTEAQRDVLAVLNGGEEVKVGEEIKVKKHRATEELMALAADYIAATAESLKQKGLRK